MIAKGTPPGRVYMEFMKGAKASAAGPANAPKGPGASTEVYKVAVGDAPTKDDVRAEAAARGLSVSAKPDSYDICFVADGNTRGFLRDRLGSHPGPIVDNSPDRWKAREAEFRSIWGGLTLRNDRIRAAVPISFRPLDDSVRDCVEALMAIAGVEPNRRPA